MAHRLDIQDYKLSLIKAKEYADIAEAAATQAEEIATGVDQPNGLASLDSNGLLKQKPKLVVESVVELRTLSGKKGETVILRSYYDGRNEGGGVFYFSETDPHGKGDDNGITFYANNDSTGSSGYWVRSEGDALKLEDFGAYGDGTTDDSPYINRALSSGRNIILSKGKTYYTTTTHTLSNNNIKIDGNNSKIRSSFVWDLFIVSGSNNIITNLYLEGVADPSTHYSSSSKYNRGITLSGNYNSLQNITISNLGSSAVYVTGDHNTINGLTTNDTYLTDNNSGEGDYGAVSLFSGDYNTVKNVVINRPRRSGLSLYNSHYNIIDGVWMDNTPVDPSNNIRNKTTFTTGGPYAGVQMGTYVLIGSSNNIFQNFNVKGAIESEEMDFRGGDNNIVRNVYSTANSQFGISIVPTGSRIYNTLVDGYIHEPDEETLFSANSRSVNITGTNQGVTTITGWDDIWTKNVKFVNCRFGKHILIRWGGDNIEFHNCVFNDIFSAQDTTWYKGGIYNSTIENITTTSSIISAPGPWKFHDCRVVNCSAPHLFNRNGTEYLEGAEIVNLDISTSTFDSVFGYITGSSNNFYVDNLNCKDYTTNTAIFGTPSTYPNVHKVNGSDFLGRVSRAFEEILMTNSYFGGSVKRIKIEKPSITNTDQGGQGNYLISFSADTSGGVARHVVALLAVTKVYNFNYTATLTPIAGNTPVQLEVVNASQTAFEAYIHFSVSGTMGAANFSIIRLGHKRNYDPTKNLQFSVVDYETPPTSNWISVSPSAAIANVASTPTVEQLSTALNSLLAACRSQGIINY